MLPQESRKQLNSPAALVEVADGKRVDAGEVGQEHQLETTAGILVVDAPQLPGTVLLGLGAVLGNRLVGYDTLRTIVRMRIDGVRAEIPLGACDKERPGLLDQVQTPRIRAGPIHDPDCTGFGCQNVQHVDIMELAIAAMQATRD